MRQKPLVVGVVGESGSGKTTLITRLAEELVRRGHRVGTAKNCPHGYDLGSREKDSWHLLTAGGEATLLTSPEESVFLRLLNPGAYQNVVQAIKGTFAGFDMVLAEGYKSAQGMQRIAVLGGRGEQDALGRIDGVIAIVSREKIDAGVPAFSRNGIDEIASFLEDRLHQRAGKSGVRVYVNGKRLRLKLFVKDIIRGVLFGLMQGLKREDDGSPIRTISIQVGEED